MVTFAVSSLADLGYVQEETFGEVPPSPALTKIRRVSSSLNLSKDTYESQEIRSDRMVADHRHGVRRVSGDIASELSVDSFDEFLQAIMGGTWTAGVSKSNTQFTSVTSDSSTKTFTFAAGNPVTEGFRVGDIIRFTNLAATANNNTDFTIVSFSGTQNRIITVAESVTTDAVADTSFTVAVVGYKLNIGNTYRSFTIEMGHTDISQYRVYKGCRVNSVAFELPPTDMVRATWGIVGQDMSTVSAVSIDAAYSDAPTNSPLAAVDATLYEGSTFTELGSVTGLTFDINNNLDGKPVVGSNTLPNILYGNKQEVTGELTVLFQNATMLNKFINETESNIFIKLSDPNGTDFLKIFFPRVKYNGGEIGDADPQGLPITMPFVALAPSATDDDDSAVVFQRSNA